MGTRTKVLIATLSALYVVGTGVLWLFPNHFSPDIVNRLSISAFFGILVLTISLSLYFLDSPTASNRIVDVVRIIESRSDRRRG